MITTPPCPKNWDYEDVADHVAIIQKRTKPFLLQIRARDPATLVDFAVDTRPFHGNLFLNLTPPGFDYFAGNYRGSNHRCLRDYEVQISSDLRVGHRAVTISIEMSEFEANLKRAIDLVDHALTAPNRLLSQSEKLAHYATVVTSIFVHFLEIHPYANGNGHMARALLLALFARHSYFPNKAWQIDPKPADPPYSDYIKHYRNGNRTPLIRFILDALS